MTRFEYLKTLPIEKAAQYLCRGVEIVTGDYPCDHCPREEECALKDNGWAKWLSAEVCK